MPDTFPVPHAGIFPDFLTGLRPYYKSANHINLRYIIWEPQIEASGLLTGDFH